MIGRILTLRLRWYGEATAQLLLRRWQAILLLSGVLGGSLLVASSQLVLVLLDDEHGILRRLAILGLWQACWALWAHMQLDQLRGGSFRDFALSMPLPSRHWRAIDLQVLLVADTPLLLPFIAAAFTLTGGSVPPAEAVSGGLLICFMVCTQLVCQLAVLGGRTHALVGLLAGNGWVACALALDGSARHAMLVLAAAAALWTLASPLPRLSLRTHALFKPLEYACRLLTRRLFSYLPSRIRLSLDILYRQHRSSVLGKVFFCLLLIVLAESLMSIWHYDGRSLPMALIASAFVALSSSGLFRYLKMAHDAARPYTGALPLSRHWALTGDALAVLSFAYPFVLVMAWTLVEYVGLSALQTAGFVASFAPLVLLLRLTQLFSDRNAVLFSTLLAVLWTIGVANILLSQTK